MTDVPFADLSLKDGDNVEKLGPLSFSILPKTRKKKEINVELDRFSSR